MSRRARKKGEEERSGASASITSFLYGTEEKPKTQTGLTEAKPSEVERREEVREAKPTVEATKPQAVAVGGVEGEVLNHIMSRGSVTKDELMAWAKSRGFRVSDVLKAIESLTGSGRIRKRLNDKGNLIYVYVK